jgi:hypothetical protein
MAAAAGGWMVWRKTVKHAFRLRVYAYLGASPKVGEGQFVRVNSVAVLPGVITDHIRIGFSIIGRQEPVSLAELERRPLAPVRFAPEGEERFFVYTLATAAKTERALRAFHAFATESGRMLVGHHEPSAALPAGRIANATGTRV